jgi:hypothetical protein
LGNHHEQNQLDPAEVGDLARCELGKWLIKASEEDQEVPFLDSLITTHSKFHQLASSIVSLINDGHNSEARNFLDNDFSDLSADIIDLLSEIQIRNRRTNSQERCAAGLVSDSSQRQ